MDLSMLSYPPSLEQGEMSTIFKCYKRYAHKMFEA